VSELIKRASNLSDTNIDPAKDIDPASFRVFRALQDNNGVKEQVGLPLVVELPMQLLSVHHHLNELSAHLSQIVRDAFSQSRQLNKGTPTHRYTSLDPMMYVRLYQCNDEIVDNMFHLSKFIPLWFSIKADTEEAGVSDTLHPCDQLTYDSLYPPREGLRQIAVGVRAAVKMSKHFSFFSAAAAFDSIHSSNSLIKTVIPVTSNYPFQTKLSVKVLFPTKTSELPNGASVIRKFRQMFEVSKEFPFVAIIGSIIGSSRKFLEDDLLEWNLCISGNSRNFIILDAGSNATNYCPEMRPNCLVPLPLLGSPLSAVEFKFGLSASKSTEQLHGPCFKAMLDLYYDLYSTYISNLYRDTVLICNLCNTPPPSEIGISYKSLCARMNELLSSPVTIKDIENALSSTSFQSLVPRPSLSDDSSRVDTDFVWSFGEENIFWKGVFAGNIFYELNEILIGTRENSEGLLNMRWNESLRRVVKHYQQIGENNLWAKPGYATLRAHALSGDHASEKHNLHRCDEISCL
jgi:hypothetical protein